MNDGSDPSGQGGLRAGQSEAEITLGLLNAVGENSALTQRSVARELGIALGLANAYLKRCIKKGLIKVNQIPPNRYAYYLTPRGFTEKSRLTAEYLASSFTFFRRARSQCAALLERCEREGWRRVALWGTGELAEIATLCVREHAVTILGVIDAPRDGETFAGHRVVARPAALGAIDAVIVTDLTDPQRALADALAALPAERVLLPDMLAFARTRMRTPEAG